MALNQALSGLNGAQSDLNVIANNIANANTTGFKGSRAEFADVYAVTGLNLNSTATGSGVRLQDVSQQFTQGDIETTNNSLDMAISGNGFFVVNDGSGTVYTRAGDFRKSSDDYVQTSAGARLQVYPPNGLGDLTAAVYLARILSGQPPIKALQSTTAAVYEILARTAKRGGDELQLETDAQSLSHPMAMVQLRHLTHPGRDRRA